MDKNVKISIKNFGFFYGETKILTDVNFDVEKNTVTSIIGPSGCGKSTLLRTFNRMNELLGNAVVDGDVIVDGVNIYSAGIDVVELRRKVGMVFQRPNPFPKTIYDNVAYGPRLHKKYSKSNLDYIVEDSLKKAALWEEVQNKLNKSALDLSGGQQQRLCIARVLAVESEILLMDEPASHLILYQLKK